MTETNYNYNYNNSNEEHNLSPEERYNKLMREKYSKVYLLTDLQYKILIELRKNRSLTQKQLGEKFGLKQNKISYHLQQIRKNNPELAQELRAFDKRTKYRLMRL